MGIDKLYEVVGKIHELEVNYSRLNWTLYTTGYDFGVEDAYKEIVKLLKNEDYYEEIMKYRGMEKLSAEDRRRVEIAYNDFRPYHLSEKLNDLDMKIKRKVNHLAKVLNTFRYKIDGKEVTSVEIQQILSGDINRDNRKKAYLARNQINKRMIDEGFIDLIKLRREYARLYGADDFVEYKLETNELPIDIFDTWEKELHSILPQMKEKREKYADRYLGAKEIMPWDEAFLAGKIAPSLNQKVDMTDFYNNIQEFFSLFNINIDEFNITYDIFPRANKSEWGYNFPVETAKDSRIIANVKNKYYEYGVLLHESGHAVHSFLMNPDEIILNRGVSGIISEGTANLFQSFLYSPLFFSKFFENDNKVKEEFSAYEEFKRISSLRSIQRIIFDHKLYRTDLESLDDIIELYWENQNELLQEPSYTDNPPWAYTIHYTTHPIYFHNYFMGDVTCYMLQNVFEEKYRYRIDEKPDLFGKFLKDEVIKPSGLYKYNDLFHKISGEGFSLKYIIN